MSDSLIRLRPWPDILYVSQGRTVLATDRDGFFDDGSQRGLFVHETRLLSRWRWLVDGRPWTPVALSNVDQGSWMGYYVVLPPGADPGEEDHGSGHMKADSEQTLELRLFRSVDDGMREEPDLTNFSRQARGGRSTSSASRAPGLSPPLLPSACATPCPACCRENS